MGEQHRREARPYLIACLTVAVATAVRLAVDPLLGQTIPYGLFFLAIAVTAQFGGFLPATLATVLSALSVNVFILEPRYSLRISDPQEVSAQALFFAIGLVIAQLGHAMQRRKRAAENARKNAQASEERLQGERNVLQAVMDGAKNAHLVYLDRHFNFVRVNETYARSCGYRPEDMIGKNHFSLYPNEENETIFRRVRDTGESVEFHDKPFVFPDQPERGVTYWDWTLNAVKGPDGRTEGLILALVETTYRRRTEAALRKSEHRYRSFVEVTTQCAWVTDANGKVAEDMPAWRKFTGQTFEQIKGEGWAAALHPDDVQRTLEVWQRAVATRTPYETEYRLRRHDGSYRLMLARGVPILDEQGDVREWVGTCIDITERKQAEEALRETVERLKLALTSGAVGVWDWNIESNTMIWDDRMYELYGVMREGSATGVEIFQRRLHPEDRARVLRELEATLRGEKQWDIEFRVQPVDGLVRHIKADGTVIRDEHGRAVRMLGVNRDTTEQKRAEAELEAERARWKGVVEGIADEVWVCDADGKMSLINLPAVTAMGLNEFSQLGVEQVLAEVDIYTPDGKPRPAHDAPLLRSLRGEIVRGEEIMRHRPTGRLRNRQFSSAPIRDADGEITGAVAIVRDVTEFRQAEAALRESERNYRIVADNTYAWEFWSDPNGKYLYVSPSCARWTGYDAEEFMRDPHLFERIIYPEDRGTYQAHRGRGEHCETEEVEFRIVRRDGVVRWMSHTCNPVYDEAGRYLGIRGSHRDVTERKEADEAFKEANRRKDEFLAMLAHELRNPMSTISAAATLLRRLELSPQAETARSALERQTKQLGKLVDDLLDISRITRGKVTLERENIDLRDPLKRALELIRPEMDQAEHMLSLQLAEESLPVYADPLRIQQILTNLLSNAARYTKSGGSITVRAWRSGAAAFVSVQDNGIGIERELQDKVFEPFMQINAGLSRSKGGLGVGLAIVKQLTELHSGSVTVWSEGIDKGTTFTLGLPLEERRAAAVEGAVVSLKPGLTFLVVDDNRDAAVLTAALLEHAGHDAKIAYDGETGAEIALQTIPDAILLDIGLPDLDGYEVARRLRAAGLRDTAIIAVTGYGQERDRVMSREAGFDAHLLKPLRYEALIPVLAEWQQNDRAERVKRLRQEKSPEHWQ